MQFEANVTAGPAIFISHSGPNPLLMIQVVHNVSLHNPFLRVTLQALLIAVCMHSLCLNQEQVWVVPRR